MTDRDAEIGSGLTAARRTIRWRAVLRDVLLVAAWVLLVTFAVGFLRWPRWAYYTVVFGGIILYSLVGDPWAPSKSRS